MNTAIGRKKPNLNTHVAKKVIASANINNICTLHDTVNVKGLISNLSNKKCINNNGKMIILK